MRKVEANPDNLTFGEFEDFEFHAEDGGFITAEKKRLYGDFRIIRAHMKIPEVTVVYREIHGIEILCDQDRKNSSKAKSDRFAVSFEVCFEIRDRDGKSVAVRGGGDRTRISYWNFGADDFYGLNFLRQTADKLLFVGACEAPARLLAMASRTDQEPAVATAAYQRAVALLSESTADAEAMSAWRGYIAFLFANGKVAEMQNAIATYRRTDRYGSEAPGLARLLREQRQPEPLVAEIQKEAVERLTRHKPKHYSSVLADILDFVLVENLTSPKPDALLWQAYLAASAERELTVLRRIWTRAVRMKADKETLSLIYNTWRGFMGPRPARLGAKTTAQLSGGA